MKKNYFQKTTLFVFALLLSNALLAVTVTWTGAGSGNRWSTSANWDTGFVPGSSDDVIIPAGSGLVRFNYSNRRARSVTIRTGSTLRILNNRTLRLINTGVSTGIFNEGTLEVNGTIEVENTTSTGIFNDGTLVNSGRIRIENQGLYGIRNDGVLENVGSGKIEFLNGGSQEALSTINGSLLNEGTLVFMAGGNGRGMSIGDDFENTPTGLILYEDGNTGRLLINGNGITNDGLIRFENSAYPYYLIYLQGVTRFTNSRAGRMEIEGCVGYAGLAVAAGSVFENRGYLNFSDFSPALNTGISISPTSRVTNHKGATMIFENVFTVVDCDGSFYNYGDIDVFGGTYGLTVSGGMVNYTGGAMNLEDVTLGIKVISSGGFYNKGGSILLTDIGTYDIQNDGDFYNTNCGFIEGDNRILNDGTFKNDAWMSYPDFGGFHLASSLIVNTGIILDPHGRFAGAIDNYEVRVTSLTNPQANVPYPNVFDVAGITTSYIGSFYLDPARTQYAGSYNYSTNTYTPNSAAIGATRLYAKAAQGNCTRIIEIQINGSVQPLINEEPEGGLMAFRKKKDKETELQNLKSFPNPTSGFFQTLLPSMEAATYDLQVLNTQGQVIAHQEGLVGSQEVLEFDLQDAPAGVYWTRLLADGQLVGQDKIVLLK